MGAVAPRAEAAWLTAVDWLREFRQGTAGSPRDRAREPGSGNRPSISNWPEADKIRHLTGKIHDHEPRHNAIPAWPRAGFRGAVARRAFRFEFVTPTTFRSGRTSVPLPLPSSVFGHYRSRWKTFAPEELRPDVAFDDLELAVAGHDIATNDYPTSRRDVTGFTGPVTLTVGDGDPGVLARLDALASIADYSGTDSYTPQGMGVTRYRLGAVLAGGPASPRPGPRPGRAHSPPKSCGPPSSAAGEASRNGAALCLCQGP